MHSPARASGCRLHEPRGGSCSGAQHRAPQCRAPQRRASSHSFPSHGREGAWVLQGDWRKCRGDPHSVPRTAVVLHPLPCHEPHKMSATQLGRWPVELG